MSALIVPDLNEVGTRYEHYSELAEVFRIGVQIVDNMEAANTASAADLIKRTRFRSAIDAIEARLSYLADFEDKKYDLWRQVNSIPRDPTKIPQDKPERLLNGSNTAKSA